MNFKSITYYLSYFCFPVSFLSFINILYSLYFDHFLNTNLYTLVLFLSFFSGMIFFFYGRKSYKRLNFFEKLILIIFSYLFISIFFSIPYYFSNYKIIMIDSFFESLSGLTLTGFSVFNNIKYFDPTLILWRSSSQWIGGLYFLIFLIIIFDNKQYDYKLTNLSYVSSFNITSEENLKKKIINITIIYTILSFLIFMLLNSAGVRLFNSLNLSMTLVSNGGFLPSNSLDFIIKSLYQKVIIIFSLMLSMLNFYILINFFNPKKLISENREDFLILSLTIIIFLILIISINSPDIINILIGVLSSLSNSGIVVGNIPENVNLYFLFLAMIGGSVVSNSGGIKFLRFYILIKSSIFEIIKLVRPNHIISQSFLFTKRLITRKDINNSFLIFISFFISIFILSSLLIIDDINFEDSFKISVLTLTNTTYSSLYGDTNISFSSLLTSSKLGILFFMIIGKIELISLFLLIKNFVNRN
ncbi:MAG: potassium transporter Trk [Candidatus Pelagibacter sp.]|nr:potassium transporter Trk [Candidatus Pelagibacter sp.]